MHTGLNLLSTPSPDELNKQGRMGPHQDPDQGSRLSFSHSISATKRSTSS
jgi:hypothetical protein